MSETTTPTPASETDTTAESSEATSSLPIRLAYAVFAAMEADFGCIVGAVLFFAAIIGSMIFYAQLTPCTSAGGIPCAP